MSSRWRTAGALTFWCFVVWLGLTATFTVESIVVGLVVSILVGWLLAPLGPAAPPWRVLVALRLAPFVVYKVVRANVSLARRIWTPSLPLATGMVVVRTGFGDEDRIAAVGIVSSLIVDNQIIDMDSSRRELVYHCVAVPAEGRRYDEINGPLERRMGRPGDRKGQRDGTGGSDRRAGGDGSSGSDRRGGADGSSGLGGRGGGGG
ncbi:Na+/H+ antiporter subunit E [Kribbella sp.]|uniref:Na+/H+ antiporter subunit E n=1 Tax=Kribbella sp. TaxID=1871183 RepID=UPI002D400EA2|nr:Na+/H+ antiporter subunit E [Kribbella sp.]HZX07608.1 Na+/H+ antiporter subunit E [Kribbella sp.]